MGDVIIFVTTRKGVWVQTIAWKKITLRLGDPEHKWCSEDGAKPSCILPLSYLPVPILPPLVGVLVTLFLHLLSFFYLPQSPLSSLPHLSEHHPGNSPEDSQAYKHSSCLRPSGICQALTLHPKIRFIAGGSKHMTWDQSGLQESGGTASTEGSFALPELWTHWEEQTKSKLMQVRHHLSEKVGFGDYGLQWQADRVPNAEARVRALPTLDCGRQNPVGR